MGPLNLRLCPPSFSEAHRELWESFQGTRSSAHACDGSLLPTAWGAASLEPGTRSALRLLCRETMEAGTLVARGEVGTGRVGAGMGTGKWS